MENMKHTKGEWGIRKAVPMKSKTGTIEITSYDILAVGINSESDEEFTAVAFCGHSKNKEAQANAKLIASAPKLLEALIEFKTLIDDEVIIIKENTDDDHANYLYNKLSKTIKEATE